MRKYIFFILLMNSVTQIFPDSIEVTKVEFTTIAEVPIGIEQGQLSRTTARSGYTGYEGPPDIAVSEDSIFVVDNINARLTQFSKDFWKYTVFMEHPERFSYGNLYLDNNNLVGVNKTGSHITIYNLRENCIIYQHKLERFYLQDISDNTLIEYGFRLFDDFLIGETNEKNFFIIDVRNGEILYMTGAEATVFFSINSENIRIIDEEFIEYKGRFTTINSKSFFDYYNERFPEFRRYHDLLIERKFNDSGYYYYTGEDSDGNYYWSRGSAVYIFNKYGTLIQRITLNDHSSTDNSPMHRYSMDPEGNLYKLVAGEDKYYLKKINRYW